ncbi:unnamed protein product [Cladocopium goreaui]|uniref:EF-hand domain-containing protein n=1 Tax=Cladocopium goreaui TaxID=2562237 RepID=A0A9P1FM79_9DINO|nr:unnamed protein product [Cladocopium goreaui]
MANGRSKLSDRNLLQAACHEFQKVDTYHRGLITSANFAKALGTLGLKYGQPEVDEILQYCTVTDDGYVHYKELHNVLSPDQPRAKQSSMKTTIYPSEASEMMASSGERNGFYVAKTEDIRKVFALWERGRISSEQFKEALQRCGAPMTAELDRLLLMYGPARSMPFSKLMYALQIDANDGRRARNARSLDCESRFKPVQACPRNLEFEFASSSRFSMLIPGTVLQPRLSIKFLSSRMPVDAVRFFQPETWC